MPLSADEITANTEKLFEIRRLQTQLWGLVEEKAAFLTRIDEQINEAQRRLDDTIRRALHGI